MEPWDVTSSVNIYTNNVGKGHLHSEGIRSADDAKSYT
jgi:hypothetical protein